MWTPPQITQEKNSLSEPPSAAIEQQTKGDNSPAVQGVDGDVTISIDQNQSQNTNRTLYIPGAEFIVLPEAPHSINWEQPEAFKRHVLEFIRRH